MGTNLLNIFSKETGATPTEQGYHYQKLKTLKTWLENRIDCNDELIFCDTDDDIVQRDIIKGTTRFRQVKLYSSNFSFSTEEVTKSLINFFMLYAKGDYLFDEIIFVFETNSNVARNARANEADLLREWASNQGALDAELEAKCIGQVQRILDNYISISYDKEKANDYEGAFLRAKNFYENLPEDFWKSFVQTIRWEFDDVPHDTAIPQLTGEITQLIKQQPLPTHPQKISGYLAALHWEIVQRTIDPRPEHRVLSNGLLDYIILHHGDKESQWYAGLFDKWSAHGKINSMHTGQFLEAIAAIRHCRWHFADSGHEKLWLKIMQQYIKWQGIPVSFRRKAIYEYLFLKVNNAISKDEADSTIVDDVSLAVDYFAHLEERYDLRDIEEDISLIQVTTTASKMAHGFADKETIAAWSSQVTNSIENHLESPRDINEHCMLLEMKGTALMSFNHGMRDIEKVKEAMNIFREIVPMLPAAHAYTISRLSDFLKQIADYYRKLGDKFEQMVDEIESFRREIASQAPETDLRHKAAHEFVVSGIAHLEAGGVRNLLRALDIFHQAVKSWRMEETMDAYVLALLGIANVYNALGANYAAKYYSLCALWAARNTGDEQCLVKQGECFGCAFKADFLQGAWLSAMASYIPYMNYRNEFDTGDPALDETVVKHFFDLARILEGAEHLHPELIYLVQFYKTQLGDFYAKDMAPFVERVKKDISECVNPAAFIGTDITDTPFNDTGNERIIRFKMLNVTWQIYFENNFIISGLAEEFASVLQVTLCEIGLYGRDIGLADQIVRIKISQGGDKPGQIVLENGVWKLSVPHHNEHNIPNSRLHYASLGFNIQYILAELSPLGRNVIRGLYEMLLKKREMGNKALSATTFQRAYFLAFDQQGFERLSGQHFSQIPGRFEQQVVDTLATAIRQSS